MAKLQKQCADLRERAKDAVASIIPARAVDRSKRSVELHRIALRELGSDAELQRALEASAGGGGAASAGGRQWRGRAQTISLLKDQLRTSGNS